jgi:hypothetical protein
LYVMYWTIKANSDGVLTYDFTMSNPARTLASVVMATSTEYSGVEVYYSEDANINFQPSADGSYDVHIAVVKLF